MDLLLILTIKSKNKKSHIIMYDCFNKFFSFQKKIILEKIKISKITLLKSPHVHKKAQQHFEQKLYKTNVVFIINSPIIFMLFKKLIDNIFLDNCIHYQYIYNNLKMFYAFLFWFSNFKINFYVVQNLRMIFKLSMSKFLDTNRLKIFTNYLKMVHLLGKSFVNV